MSSLISDVELAQMNAALDSLVATTARALYVYQEATQVVINTNPNYNPIDAFNQNNTENIINVPNYTLISGRILYDKQQEYSFIRPYIGQGSNEGQIKIKDQITRAVRIKVDATGYALLSTAKKMQLDGEMFDSASLPRPHGLLGPPTYWTFYFVRSL